MPRSITATRAASLGIIVRAFTPDSLCALVMHYIVSLPARWQKEHRPAMALQQAQRTSAHRLHVLATVQRGEAHSLGGHGNRRTGPTGRCGRDRALSRKRMHTRRRGMRESYVWRQSPGSVRRWPLGTSALYKGKEATGGIAPIAVRT